MAIHRYHRHGGASVLCFADLGAAVPAAFVPLISARCAVTSQIAGWLRLIYHDRLHGVAGDILVLLVAVVIQMLTAILFCRCCFAGRGLDAVMADMGQSCDRYTALYC